MKRTPSSWIWMLLLVSTSTLMIISINAQVTPNITITDVKTKPDDGKKGQDLKSTVDIKGDSLGGVKPLFSSSIAPPSQPPNDDVLPVKGAAEQEHSSSMAIFFVLCVLGRLN